MIILGNDAFFCELGAVNFMLAVQLSIIKIKAIVTNEYHFQAL